MMDPTKFFSGVLTSATAMTSLSLPQVNVMSKMDLVEMSEYQMNMFLDVNPRVLEDALNDAMPEKYKALNRVVVDLVPLSFSFFQGQDKHGVGRTYWACAVYPIKYPR